tara:strand:- start:1070 stop:1420 length:351 start_codon:yes stop_codon:yes gene_type:complete
MKLHIYILYILFTFLLSESEFENVKVLDITSKSEMRKYMKSISKDLGVKCSYCHDMDDKSIDTPEKDITREMIKLTRYLNDLLNNEKEDTTNHATYVTCWTCHYGKTQPASIRPEE